LAIATDPGSTITEYGTRPADPFAPRQRTKQVNRRWPPIVIPPIVRGPLVENPKRAFLVVGRLVFALFYRINRAQPDAAPLTPPPLIVESYRRMTAPFADRQFFGINHLFRSSVAARKTRIF
jgi:hypothetical protein